jgi:hypothetical protein
MGWSTTGAWLDDRELCTSTKPFLDAARLLIAEGVAATFH